MREVEVEDLHRHISGYCIKKIHTVRVKIRFSTFLEKH